MKMKALIADDEPLSRERLRFLLAPDEDIEIVGECSNGSEVIQELKRTRIDALFLDVQMPGKSGFEIVEEVGRAHMPIVVFVTAHCQYALQAFEIEALDYLTKPVEAGRLATTVRRLKERLISNAALVALEELKSTLNGKASRTEFPKRLLVRDGTIDSFVNVDDIEWIEAADYYCCLHVGTNKHMLRQSIKQLASTLDPWKFVRIHRSIIVNMQRISRIFREGQSEGVAVLTNGKRLKMSRAGWQNLVAANHL